jgi:uracil-DNA glycosylase
VSAAAGTMTKVLDEESRRAVAARVRFYRELGIYDLYRRDAPAGLAIEREELARMAPADVQREAEDSFAEEPSADAETLPPILQDKPAALRAIREDIGDCTRCRLCQARTHIVFGVGDPQARILFVGEGPGADEDAQGEPFVGRAGQLLNNMIQAMGLRREQVYIANVVKCRPPQNRTPERDECATCGPFLMRQIAAIRPEMIVALGATAAKFLLGVNDAMANLRGRIYDFHPVLPKDAPERDPGFTTKLVVTYHPAYLLRDPRQKKEAWLDLQQVMKYLDMPLPRRNDSQSNPEG